LNKKTDELQLFIVEDDTHFRDTFVDVMGLRGVSVSGSATALEGLHELRSRRPDVIILDVQLPDMHGFELCKRIKRIEAFRKTPVIFVSASSKYNDPRDQVEGVIVGGSHFLPKPITMEKLWAQIETVLTDR
jgi:DNA-binding response OmpR family regulator